MKTFGELTLSPALQMAIAEMGFTTPTPIQAQTLPILLQEPTDFLGMAATGTGKTAAFGIPLLERIDEKDRSVQAVILCPTRELAVQTAKEISALGKYKKIEAKAIYGGTSFIEQRVSFNRGLAVIVATPGRLVDHLRQGTVSLEKVRTIVLDEADEMISMGFQEELEYVLKHIPSKSRNTWLFAATMSQALRKVADQYLNKPKTAQINRKDILSGTVKQIYYTVREKNKPKGLCKLIDMADDFYGLIFCQTKVLVVELTQYLSARGYRVDCLHGDKTQFEREKTFALFREKQINILVCSDVAARGLDVKELTHVINYSLPVDSESYIHRIGRTGRSGKAGMALSLVAPSQMNQLERIERVTKTRMELDTFPSRKVVSIKKMARLLPKFTGALGHEKATEVLDEPWLALFEGMTKTEIAARFLALQFPDLFDDREKAEEVGLGEAKERPKRERFIRPEYRNEDGSDEGGESRSRFRPRFRTDHRPEGRPPFGAYGRPDSRAGGYRTDRRSSDAPAHPRARPDHRGGRRPASAEGRPERRGPEAPGSPGATGAPWKKKTVFKKPIAKPRDAAK